MENNEEKTPGEMLEMMMKGAFDDAEISEQIPEDSVDIAEEGGDVNNEDTEGNENLANGETAADDTEGSTDGVEAETSGGEDTEGKEEDSANAPVETDKTDEAETAPDADGKKEGDAEVDYRKLYEESQVQRDFYDKVTSSFKANGKTVNGFKDPDKIIQAQQVMYGLDKKYSALKNLRPFQDTLEKQGMIKDPAKFDLAMDLVNGNKEAIKQHLKNLEIDPVLDLELDNVNYQRENHTTSDVELSLRDVIDNADSAGVKARAEQVLYKDWDEDSVYELLGNPEAKRDLITHLTPNAEGETIFDMVQSRIDEKSITDGTGEYKGLKQIDKYKIAAHELEQEYVQQHRQEPARGGPSTEDLVAKAREAEQARVLAAENAAVEKYKASIAKSNKSADEGRKKAASMSKPKASGKSKSKKDVNPMDLTGDSFMDYWSKLEKAGI